MIELKIQQPCIDCPLFVGSGEDILDIYDRRLLPMARDGVERALGCKHPWRVAFKRFGSEPNVPQKAILSKLVEMRHKNPAIYGLEPTQKEDGVKLENYSTIIESLASEIFELLKEEKVGKLEDLLEQAEDVFDTTTLQGLLSQLYTNQLDVPSEVFDAALAMAIIRVNQTDFN